MFERFTDRARRVIVLAQEEAREAHTCYIGAAHIFVGLLRTSDDIADALAPFGVSVPAARAAILKGSLSAGYAGHIPFTPSAKRVFELALTESQRRNVNYLSVEHLLLGLMTQAVEHLLAPAKTLDADQIRVQSLRLELADLARRLDAIENGGAS
jgi:ATP-dependent Clp protease ATP-binding subunit ClpC